ncbi:MULTISPECIES: sugar O-acetyltransferase [Vibrio]|mgnify:CR=1 FL=1|uniref:Nodulation protein L n=1 Tax=Vibrio proteolyticus NBRC 13287 TaxID=1219065 RepID=U2ZGT8_VIBPR|nr:MULTISPECIES: sugar O-acetyltransferase [Vibrio]NAX19797.1 sugar O-acetyltransferase [Vibrio sp. V39_P1S14PM300]GAD66886.1 galactoside O-acetyltransferase [Vibrio proteolyticus NBRC 13287]
MTEFEKMTSGELFDGGDESINVVRDKASELGRDLNQTSDEDTRRAILNDLLAQFGEGSVIRSPFCCEFGQTISIGHNTFINMNATMLDGAHITIGNHVLIGPNAQFYTAGHSLDYRRRRTWETFCQPIVVEDDVWIGGNVVINQGVTIGARSVIAANSVVTRDVPPDSLVGGTPAKLIRRLTENDS